jgi:hypothetical protein
MSIRRRLDLRLPAELVERVDARAEELGQTRTKFVERALEAALATDGGGGSPGVSKPVVPTPPRAPEPKSAEVELPKIAKRKW